jgi:G:T-mismatch repair DNA endonuclease (very short patch repair protein)
MLGWVSTWMAIASMLMRLPHNNSAFWEAKFNANRERDARKIKELQRAKFDVLTIPV